MEPHPSARFFTVAQPVPKSVFLDAYEETTTVAQLLVAPFGLPSIVAGSNGSLLDKDTIIEDYTNIYRQWEDVLSRKIYAAKGIPDDRVAATIHRYLEVKKDMKVMEIIQAAAGAMGTLLDLPTILELPCSSSSRTHAAAAAAATVDVANEADVVTSAAAAAMLMVLKLCPRK